MISEKLFIKFSETLVKWSSQITKTNDKGTYLSVARDGNVDVSQGVVRVGQSNDGDVHVGRLQQRLTILDWVGENQHRRLEEVVLDLIGKSTRGETSSNGTGTSVLAKLEDSTLGDGGTTGRASVETDSANILRVLNSDDGTGSEDELLPSLAEIKDVGSSLVTVMNVTVHARGKVGGSNVDVARQHLLQVRFSKAEDRRELAHLGVKTQVTTKTTKLDRGAEREARW